MKKIVYILLISNFVFAQNAILDTNTILIGQQTKLTITNHISSTKNWPNYNEFLIDGIEILNASEIDTIDEVIKQQFIITAWDSGSYVIPSFIFSENNKTEEILINVQSLILGDNPELKDIKQPIKEPIGWSDVWPWILAILILILIGFLIKKYLFSKKENKQIIKTKVIIPADIVALKELNKLENEKIFEKGKIKEYYSQLSEIIRRYIELRFKFIALELTTNEILQEFKPILDKQILNNLEILLQRADLAKFAKSEPSETENMESMILAKEFVNNTKYGFETLVGERGVQLSGGQRQRIGIARALYKDSMLIFFDEATSALDKISEEEVVKSIDRLKRDLTIIMIAHRTSTLMHCDRIVCLENGKITKEGKPDEILQI